MRNNPAHRAGAVVGVFAGDTELSLALEEGIGLVKHGCSPVDLGAVRQVDRCLARTFVLRMVPQQAAKRNTTAGTKSEPTELQLTRF